MKAPRTPQPPDPSAERREENLCVQIFSVSATLVGACLTVIGLFRAIHQLQSVDGLADNILAVDALGFMLACLFAYFGLRSREDERRRRMERLADRIFLTSLGLMTVVCAMVAYELI